MDDALVIHNWIISEVTSHKTSIHEYNVAQVSFLDIEEIIVWNRSDVLLVASNINMYPAKDK